MLLVVNYGDLLGGGQDVRMHVPYSLVGIAAAQLADIFLLALLLFAVLATLERSKRLYPWVRFVLAVVVPPYIFVRMRQLIPIDADNGLLVLAAFVWAAVLLVLLVRFNRWYRAVIRFGDAVGVFLFVFALCSIAQLLLVMLWRPGPQQHIAAWAQDTTPRDHPKLVWIVFDELSFDQLFEHRARDLALPNFDALRSESTLFTNVEPIGTRTVNVIPALLSGRGIDDTRFTFGNHLQVHYVGLHGWHPLRGPQTVFHDAQQSGWRTAVVGWYNPYCSIYAGSIDDCYFTNLDRTDGDMAQRASLWHNTYEPLAQVVREIKAPARADKDSCNIDVRQRLQTFLDLRRHTLDELSRDQADMIFLHLPVPHSPNIWSRMEDNYTTFCDSSYLDNLALADRTLGEIMAKLQASPRWKDTTVIVEGDHSWRTYLWDWTPAWTEQDDAASRNGYDPRPAMLIHLAGQSPAAIHSARWSLLNIHAVVEQVLHGQPVTF